MPKKFALFMTVGLGGKTQNEVDSLAHGMLDTIIEGNFDYVVFFGSKKSKKTIKSLKRQYREKFKTKDENGNIIYEEFDYCEFIPIEEIHSFNPYYDAIKSKIKEYENDYEIKVNYTPGTKTMSVAAAISSLVYRKTLRTIDGERGEDGRVIKGTEVHIDYKLYAVYDEILIRRIKRAFNNCHFSSGRLFIDDLTDRRIANDFYSLFDVYSNWDNVNFKKAHESFDKNFKHIFSELSNRLDLNIKALNIINKKNEISKNEFQYHKYKKYYELASIINNADRRASEKKYDDAIARLYRSFELIGQIRLEDYGIKSNNVDINILNDSISDDFIKYLDKKKDNDNKIKIGLDDDFKLLNELGDDLGKYYIENKKKIRNVNQSRNNSIFAHGLEPKTIDEYNNFKKIVLEFANKSHNKMSEFLEDTVFPKFNI